MLSFRFSQTDNYYAIFGLTFQSTTEDIINAFQVKISKLTESPADEIARITSAYTTLIDPQERAYYDLAGKFHDMAKLIALYKDNPEQKSGLSFFSKALDPDTGIFRSIAYKQLYAEIDTFFGQAVITLALIRGGGTKLKQIAIERLVDQGTQQQAEDCINDLLVRISKDSRQDDLFFDSIGQLVLSIIKKADGGKAADFEMEIRSIKGFINNHEPKRISPGGPAI